MSDISPQISSTAQFTRPVEVFVVRKPEQRYWLHILLLVATVFTTLVVGARMEFNFLHGLPAFSLADNSLGWFPAAWAFTQPSRLLLGIPFAATLMLILLAHEMGHYLYCVYYDVFATLPYFIPAPTLIGTFGAFIRIRAPIRSRKALFDIGIAGPIAGFVVALLVLVISLPLSRLPAFGSPPSELGYPLIFKLLWPFTAIGHAHPQALQIAYMHPMAIAAWVGMFATALNLLPGGQLDGGHIVYAVAPRFHKWVSILSIVVLVPLAIYGSEVWALWAVFLGFSGMRHPPVPRWPEMDNGRRWLAILGLLMLILTFTPAPFEKSSILEIVRSN